MQLGEQHACGGIHSYLLFFMDLRYEANAAEENNSRVFCDGGDLDIVRGAIHV